MSETWLKCKYCGHEIHAATLEGDIENHNCKDRQIAALKERLDAWRATKPYVIWIQPVSDRLKSLGEL